MFGCLCWLPMLAAYVWELIFETLCLEPYVLEPSLLHPLFLHLILHPSTHLGTIPERRETKTIFYNDFVIGFLRC